MKRVVIVWPGFTGYMGPCFKALAERCNLKVFIEPSRYEQQFDGRDLEGLDWQRVEREGVGEISWSGRIEAAVEEIRLFRPDLVLVCGWSTPLSRAVAAADLEAHPRKVLAFDMPWEWSLRKLLAPILLRPRLRSFDAAFVPGARCARYARWLGFTDNRLVLGSNPSGWERMAAAREAGVPGGDGTRSGFVYVGRLSSEKGLDVLVAAYERYRTRVENPWRLDLVGAGTLPAAEPRASSCTCLGFVRPEAMPGVMSEHACLVLPSRWEPWGVSAAEAMSAGLQTILSDACGLTADVKPTRLVRSGDIEALARAMVEIHQMTREAREAESLRVRTEMVRYSAANWADRVMGMAGGPNACGASVVSGFWEEHCTECAMPLCYGTCPMFERGWHGRCVRVDGFEESVEGTGTVTFRRWGKLELMFHGTLIGGTGASRLTRANRRFGGLWRVLGRYHRALRWRLAAWCGQKGVPTAWRLRLKGERNELLCATVAYEDGRETFRMPLEVKAGEVREWTLELPAGVVSDGALFRLFPMSGEATGPIEILENRVGEGEKVEVERGVGEISGRIKCVAWDLDGTLWDGVLSEGDDVKLRSEVVETIKALDACGIVNSICSKNDHDVAMAKLKAFGLEEYFVFPQVNWGPKSASLKNLAREMNIGLEAIAFVDDREENRSEVRANCPEVRVFREDEHRGLVDRRVCGAGAAAGLGSRRREMYREEMARRGAAERFGGDAAAFLAQSGLEVELQSVEGERKARCFELVNRTNQLTIAGRRYTEEAFASLIAAGEARAVHVRDKYGDYGIVGFVAWDKARIAELVFSCRVACKGVERRVLEMLPEGLEIEVVATERNAPIRKIVAEWLEGRK